MFLCTVSFPGCEGCITEIFWTYQFLYTPLCHHIHSIDDYLQKNLTASVFCESTGSQPYSIVKTISRYLVKMIPSIYEALLISFFFCYKQQLGEQTVASEQISADKHIFCRYNCQRFYHFLCFYLYFTPIKYLRLIYSFEFNKHFKHWHFVTVYYEQLVLSQFLVVCAFI